MVDQMVVTVLFSSTILIMILYLLRRTTRSRYLQLPGPREIPIVGNFFQIDKMNMHLTLDEWGYKYGEIFSFKSLGQTYWVINSSDIVRELYLQEPMATITSGRNMTFSAKYVMDNDDIILSSFSPEWAYRRKKAHQLLPAYGEGLRDIEHQLTQILDKIGQKIKKSEHTVVDPSEFIHEFLLESMESLVTGRQGDKELLNPGIDRILTTFPIIRYLPCYFGDLFNRCITTRKTMMNIIQSKQENNPTSSGMYKNLLDVVREGGKKDKKIITMQTIAYILQDLIGAGHVTTYASLMSIIKILLCQPQVQTKMQLEIREVIGLDRHPLISDRENCHYTQAVILESLRYNTNIPLAGHYTMAEFEFRRKKVPKGITILANTWHIHHNEKEWENQFQFKPERFLDEDGKLVAATHPNRKRFIAFGIGKRSCIGEVLAKSRLFLFLAHVLQHYTISPPAEKNSSLFHPTEMKPGLVLLPTDFTCKFIPRCYDIK